MSAIVRLATEGDVPAILDIYNEAILHSTATFDIEPHNLEERLQWFRETKHPHCVIVAEVEGGVVGWGCLSSFRARAAYRFTTEDSVYIHKDYRGQGIGVLLLGDLIERAKKGGFHSVMASVTEGNPASEALHKRFGFVAAGRDREVGYKFERWLDVISTQLMLPPGA